MKEKPMSYRVAMIGLFGALTVVLSALESTLPPLPVPAMRLGLANVALTAAAALFGAGAGVCVAVIKLVFVLLTRGATAALMASGGTALALLVTVLLLGLYRREMFSFVGVSVAAAGAHTAGQLLVSVWLLGAAVMSYAPLLLVVSIPAGIATGLLLNVLIPRLVPIIGVPQP